MTWRLVRRRTVWWPTRFGWACFLLSTLALVFGWCFCGESFLSPTSPLPADALVVEGWAGRDSLPAAVREFRRGGYGLLVTSGGSTGDSWAASNWNYADLAAEVLLHKGMPKDRLLSAPASANDSQRTYQAALAVRMALEVRGPLPAAINVWTRGPHARRSRLVFARVFGSQTQVGVIAWTPEDQPDVPWWKSSERSRDFLGESVGYFYERLLWSGRWLGGGAPMPKAPPGTTP
jgi:hypothetical protein